MNASEFAKRKKKQKNNNIKSAAERVKEGRMFNDTLDKRAFAIHILK